MLEMKDLINHLKNTGYVNQSSEIYGGLANTWDYGHLGIELRNNIKNNWWNEFVKSKINVVGYDSSIILNPDVWKASGHVDKFSDPLIDCLSCKSRYRVDKLLEEKLDIKTDNLTKKELENNINKINCPKCNGNSFTKIREFNLLFKSYQGVIENEKSTVFLRPETAQGIYINFSNIQRATRFKIPFGVAQIGKSFRNEITPGNFIFRTREFEQMELEFFTKIEDENEIYENMISNAVKFLVKIGIKEEKIKLRKHDKNELAHYSSGTTDLEFLFPFGWGEIIGISKRTNFDLNSHNEKSNEKIYYLDPSNNEKIIPNIVESSFGLDRIFLSVLVNSYEIEKLNETERIVLKLKKEIAPYKAAVLPLTKKISKYAIEIFEKLSKKYSITFDENGSIGKRYRRQDSIGTPICITFDYDSINDKMITIRDRDTMEQKRILIDEIHKYI